MLSYYQIIRLSDLTNILSKAYQPFMVHVWVTVHNIHVAD